MHLIRQANPSDASALLKLAKMVHFINLPPDREVILERIRRSRASFAQASLTGTGALVANRPENGSMRAHLGEPAGLSPVYMFILEDTATANPIGTSSVVARMGTPGNPNVAFQLSRREFFSRDLQTGATHVVAKLILDEDGPTEVGGLILAPSYRANKAKLGRLLSFVRFHYIALHRKHFRDRLLAEMMAALTPQGGNSLWEYLGRRFINLSYSEADRFCAYSREFMTSLLPREEIYLTLLPPEARALIGQVGVETIPARRMLERLGFRCYDRVDPFDGGPHLEAMTDEVPPVKDTRLVTLEGATTAKSAKRFGIVSCEMGSDGRFRALQTNYVESGDGVRLPAKVIKTLSADAGMSVGVTPLDAPVAGTGSKKPSTRAKKPTGDTSP